MAQNTDTESIVWAVNRRKRKKSSSEGKIRIVLEGYEGRARLRSCAEEKD